MKNFDELLKKYADFIVRVGVNPQPGQTMIIRCPLEAAPLARLCVRSGFEAGARDVQVDWSDNAVSRTRMELGSEEALTDSKPYQLRRYLDYAESEGSVCVLHLIADDPEVYAGLDGAKISRVNAANRKFMAPWREYTMDDRVQWSIAAMPSAPWAKKMFPELEPDAAIEKLWQLIFDVCRVTGGDPVNEWKAHLDRLTSLGEKMNALDLESVHFESANGTDLTVGLAEKASWESAGSKNLIHMHGELLKARCPVSGQVIEWRGELHQAELCSCCQLPQPLRPHVVWFGEMPLGLDRIYSALAQCDLFISIGTSGAVYPAAGFVHEAGLNGAHTVELNLEPSEVGSQFDEKRYGPASLLVPAFVDELLQSCGVHQPKQIDGHNWMEMRGP